MNKGSTEMPGSLDWNSFVEAPWVVEDEDQQVWSQTTDWLVVGFGGAGATAALRASQNGLDVIALDKADGGGATLASGGVFYAGGGTRIQQQLNEQDTPENMYHYLKLETGGIISDETLMRFCRNSAANLDWLMEQGVEFGGPVWKEKTSYPNVDYFLYHSDNSLLPAFQKQAWPAARGHRGVIRKGRSAVNLGGSIYTPLQSQCRNAGVQIETKTEAFQLVISKRDGAVIGVRGRQLVPGSKASLEHSRCLQRGHLINRLYPFFLPGARRVRAWAGKYYARAAQIDAENRQIVTYRARVGVCLSAGGFIFNRQMVEQHCPQFAAGMPLGTPADDGSGIRLGQSVGAVASHMDRATAWRFINPPSAWSKGIMVDHKGQRFVNETCYGATIGDAMIEKAGGKAWLILDDYLVRQAWRQIWPSKVLPFQWQLGALNMLLGKKKFRSLEEICSQCGFDPDTLLASLQATQELADGIREDVFEKASSDARALVFPLHVIDVSLGAKLLPCTVLTMGGLAVDEATGQVKSEHGGPIKGLYAAGRTAVGIPSYLYMSGLSIADCIFSGLRAADHASQQLNGEDLDSKN